jgi:hypothetical protein
MGLPMVHGSVYIEESRQAGLFSLEELLSEKKFQTLFVSRWQPIHL